MKEAVAGLMAILNQGTDAWDELSDKIDNSTSSVQFFNENMSIVGKSGAQAQKYIEHLKEVFEECEERATALGMTSKDLALSISLLGHDGNVTSKNINDLMDAFDGMNTVTEESEKIWRTMGKAEELAINTGYDYNSTISSIDSSITGLTQSQKESIKSQLKENMTFEEADKVLSKYGLSAEKTALSTLSTSEKIDYLRDSLKGCSEEEIKATLAQLGLTEAFDEVSEILDMSDEDYKKYIKNMQTVEGMSKQLAKAMDETTKGSFLNLASAIENVAISAFEKLKPAIQGTSDALYEFFEVWHNGDKNEFTFDGLEQGLAGLEEKVRTVMPNITNAIRSGIEGINTFINGGALDSILQIGTDIIQSIATGITQACENGTLTQSISGLIEKICNWIIENGPAIQKAGEGIIDAIKEGIINNKDAISGACDVIFDVINAWFTGKSEVFGQLAATVGLSMMQGMAEGFLQGVGTFLSNVGTFIAETIANIIQSRIEFYNAGIDLIKGLIEGIISGEVNIGDALRALGEKILEVLRTTLGIASPSKFTMEMGQFLIEGLVQGLVENIGLVTEAIATVAEAVIEGFKGIFDKIFGKEDNKTDLINIDTAKIQEAQAALNSLNATVTTVTNNIRTSFTSMTSIISNQCINMTNIIRNQFVNMTNIIRSQFVNMTNIINNQCVNMTNVARTQFVNMANIARTQFVNMANIARNQFVAMTNIVRSQFVNMTNIITNQSQNARNSATSSFISLAKVIQTQMSNAYSSVSSYMAKIAAATNVTLNAKVNVSKTVTTTEVTVPANQSLNTASSLRFINNLATSSNNLGSISSLSRVSSLSSNNSIGGAFSGTKQASNQTIEVPVYLDGKQIAKASAKYMGGELKSINDRESRKSGKR